MIRIPLGVKTDEPGIVVDEFDGNCVRMTIEAEPLETIDDRDVTRFITPRSARALAAMLWHMADEAER